MLFTRTKKGIGLIITHIQNDGMLRVTKAGGIRAGMYPGHKVVIHGYAGTIFGAVIPTGDKNDVKPSDLIIDIGAKSSDEARKYVQEGDPIHFHTYHEELLNGRLCARATWDFFNV